MQSASIRKWLLALTLLVVILWTIVHFYDQGAQKAEKVTRIILEPQGFFSYRKPEISASKTNKPSVADAAAEQKNLRQKVEEWLALHHRSAESLLAAFHVLDDTNYLKEAATNFPNDPRVELTVLTRNAFPDDRRKWLDLLQASSPGNALASYLSAQTYFSAGQSEAAVKDLVAATAKPDFENYTLESQLDTEELGLFCGESPSKSVATALAGSATDSALTLLKQLASQMTDLQKQELNVGDNNSAENLAQMGMTLGDQLNSGANGNYLINQQASLAVESMMLDQLDANTGYDFLDGETPGQKLREIKQQEFKLSQLVKNFEAIQPALTDAEQVSFQERVKIYGQVAAMQWALQQRGNPQGNQQ
ncbi:MAG TPA: hypothetical protein VMA35_04115 [Candidatus Sulfopaludibacter sp.]|nr:hypothetical protein [Candidatus Sulfopaludibacter sp.]